MIVRKVHVANVCFFLENKKVSCNLYKTRTKRPNPQSRIFANILLQIDLDFQAVQISDRGII